MRKVLAVLLTFMLVMSVTGITFARPAVGPPEHAASGRPQIDELTYLNLGDSIALGLSADPESSYYDFYAEYLGDYGAVSSDNTFSELGITSWELLGDLATDGDLQEAVSDANIITVSIGGNNLLGGMIGKLFIEYGLNPAENCMEDLTAAIMTAGEDVWYAITEGLTEMLQDPAPDCPLWFGSNQFVADWPLILDAIHTINPNAHVIVLTIYNPIDKDEAPVLHDLIEELLKPMNQVLRQNQGRRASVANVHRAFLRESDAVGFSVAWIPHLDPHPTNDGHQMIFEELMKVRNPRAFR